MKLLGMHSVLRSVAVSALLHMAVPVADAWAADEVQVLRKAPSAVTGAMPFTTFQQEELVATNALPCKWISKDGRVGPSYGSGRYDFLCKGGDFATVNMYLDKGNADGVGRVRLMYREWNSAMNPNAGEAKIAQQFLAHVVGRFVPAAAAGQAMDTYWGQKNRQWVQDNVEITFDLEKGQQFNVRKLTLMPKGKGQGLGPKVVPVIPAAAGLAKAGAATNVPDVAPVPALQPVVPVQPQGVQVYMETPDGQKKPIPAVTPTDAGLSKPVLPAAPSVVLPVVPVGVLPVPGVGANNAVNGLVVPVTAPAGGRVEEPKAPEQAGGLEQATPAELNTAPAPESKVVPVPVAAPSGTLVPTGQDAAVGNAVRAPSNFDIYNKAMELTKDVEARAQIQKVEDAKVTASKPVGPDSPAPALKPVPTPGEAGQKPVTGEGLGNGAANVPAVQPTVPAAPKVEEVGQPTNYQGPRRTEARPLPQLKFVPKAEPLRTPDNVIQFEDEKSRL